MSRGASPRDLRVARLLDWWLAAMIMGGFAINVLLLIQHWRGGAIAGCGGGSPCQELLTSRWAQVWGIPVTAFGGAVYVALALSFVAGAGRLRGPSVGLIAGAAVWFIFVQAVLFGRFCPWCMAAHGIGLAVALLVIWREAGTPGASGLLRSIGGFAAAAVVGIATLQVLGPRPVTHRVAEWPGAAGPPLAATPAAAVHARGSGRKVEFHGGRKTYDVAALPHLGPADAQHVMVEYFDYSCAACQTMSGYLDALLAKHPTHLCVVTLPVPLERSCNHGLPAGQNQYPDACAMARLALALWRVKPAAFAAFHRASLDDPSLAAAQAHARQLVAGPDLDAALQDPWIEEIIQANIADWLAFSATRNNLPKLLISGKRILHGLPSGQEDFIRVLEHELGL